MNLIQWKSLLGYEGLYKISSAGEIVREQRNIVTRNGHKKKLKERVMRQSKAHAGYLKVTLTKDKSEKTILVHILVARCFIPNPENKPQVNHKNGIKDDNRVENLEWCSRSENIQHAYDIGLTKPQKGSDHGLSKLREKDIISIKKSLLDGESQYILADLYGVDQSLISKIKNNKIWKHVEE